MDVVFRQNVTPAEASADLRVHETLVTAERRAGQPAKQPSDHYQSFHRRKPRISDDDNFHHVCFREGCNKYTDVLSLWRLDALWICFVKHWIETANCIKQVAYFCLVFAAVSLLGNDRKHIDGVR